MCTACATGRGESGGARLPSAVCMVVWGGEGAGQPGSPHSAKHAVCTSDFFFLAMWGDLGF